MTTTLHSEPVTTVLNRLLANGEHDDIPHGLDDAALSAADKAELAKDIYIAVSADAGKLLYLLARAIGARTVVEYGLSFGVSTLHLAAALRDNGGGTVITTELAADKARAAGASLSAAGLADLVQVRLGDARDTLRDLDGLDGPVDLLLLDGWPELALDVLRTVEPRLRPGALVLTDDTDLPMFADTLAPLFAYLDDPANGYHSAPLHVGDGMHASIRLG